MEEKRFASPEVLGERTSDPVVSLAPGALDQEQPAPAERGQTSSEPIAGIAPGLPSEGKRPSGGPKTH